MKSTGYDNGRAEIQSGRVPSFTERIGHLIKLRSRIAIMAALLLTPLVLQAVIVINSNAEAQDLASTIGNRADPATRLLLNIDRDAYQAQLALERLEIATSETGRDASLESLRENLQQIGDRFTEFEQLALGLDGEDVVIREFRTFHQQWAQNIDETVIALAVADEAHDSVAARVVAGDGDVDTTEASATRAEADQLLGATRESFELMRNRIDVLEEDFYEAEVAALFRDLNSGVAATTSAVWLTLIIGMSIGTAAALLIGRWIALMVTNSTSTLDAVSVTVEGAAEQLGTVVETTVGTVGTVAGMAGEVSNKINETMDAVDAFSESIDEISNKADRASVVAQDAAHLANSTNESVAKLADSSEEIGLVIEVITSIAKQTNLLALNATIEAARAGEAGKGFGVVANEVKELAKQTTDAIDQISARVGAIQQDTGESIAAIESITAVIAEIAEIQTSIASAVDQQTSTTTEIAGFVDHAVTRSAEIVSSVEDISAATRTVEGQVGASRSAANEVRHVAKELNEMVGRTRTPARV